MNEIRRPRNEIVTLQDDPAQALLRALGIDTARFTIGGIDIHLGEHEPCTISVKYVLQTSHLEAMIEEVEVYGLTAERLERK